jgi:hypothetical protein
MAPTGILLGCDVLRDVADGFARLDAGEALDEGFKVEVEVAFVPASRVAKYELGTGIDS